MKVVTLDERGEQIRRKLATGVCLPAPEKLRNGGLHRTAGKRELLQVLRDAPRVDGRDGFKDELGRDPMLVVSQRLPPTA